jgi:hypothetical protein
MATTELLQAEADALIAMAKIKVGDDLYDYPGTGGSLVVPLTSQDKREEFLLDIYRGRIDLLKGTYQNRGRQIIVLVRIDFGGAPHETPTERNCRVRTCISTARGTVISGRYPCLPTNSRTSVICG